MDTGNYGAWAWQCKVPLNSLQISPAQTVGVEEATRSRGRGGRNEEKYIKTLTWQIFKEGDVNVALWHAMVGITLKNRLICMCWCPRPYRPPFAFLTPWKNNRFSTKNVVTPSGARFHPVFSHTFSGLNFWTTVMDKSRSLARRAMVEICIQVVWW